MAADDNRTPAPRLPSKRFVALLYLPLTLPAMLPLYFAREQEDPALVAVMVATTLVILVVNAVVLIALYRYFGQGASS